MQPISIPTRAQVAPEDKWRTSDLFVSDEAFYEAVERIRGYIPRLAAFQGKLGQSGQMLLDFYRLDDELSDLFDPVAHYAQRRADEDTRVPAYQEMSAKVTRLSVEIHAAASFFTPELLAIDEDKLEAFFAQTEGLAHYRRAIERVRARRAHVLSDREEALLAAAGELAHCPDDIFSMLNDADLRFGDALDSKGVAHPVTHSTYVPLLQSYDRTLRKNAFDALYTVYAGMRHTLAATLSAQMKSLLFFAQARKYGSTLEAALDGSEVAPDIYRNLIDAVGRNLAPMHRYVALRKRLLGLDELHMYDLYVPVVAGVKMQFTFAQAKELVRRALAPLGEDYLAILDECFAGGWIDVYENEGKRSGAYSAGALVHPYILLNFKGTLDDVFTLVHELGHAVHSYLSNKTQATAYRDYVIFVAEVASTCNEALLMEYLLRVTEDKTERAYILNHFLEQFRATMYRQTMFAEFELAVNERVQAGEGTTADALSTLYHGLNEKYFGTDMVIDAQIDCEWARIPHFYYNYYVYQYATGYAAAIALSRRILREGAPAVRDYLGFLSGGCSHDPITLLRGAGVDMASAQPIEDAAQLFDTLLDEMEQLLGEGGN